MIEFIEGDFRRPTTEVLVTSKTRKLRSRAGAAHPMAMFR